MTSARGGASDWATARPLAEYTIGTVVTVDDRMQTGYSYTLTAHPGDMSDHPEFQPYFSPQEMLGLGILEGKYCNDCYGEFPREWYSPTTMSTTANPRLNYFGIKSRQSRGEWLRKGWIPCCPGDSDVRGWIQWYFRFFLGRRLPAIDAHQIARWRAFKRHFAQVVYNCAGGTLDDPSSYGSFSRPGDLTCRRKQRQALLQWSWNCFA
jgi:hypothetical protein